MSAHIIAEVYCDGEGCDSNNADSRFFSTIKRARTDMADNGWVNKGRKDYCEECSRELQEEADAQNEKYRKAPHTFS